MAKTLKKSPTVLPFLKRPGGKRYMAKKIIPHLPKTMTTYVEPFLGGGSIFLNLDPASYDQAVLSDSCYDVISPWQAIESGDANKMVDALKEILYSEEAFLDAVKYCQVHEDYCGNFPLADAIYRVIKLRMSRGGMGEAFGWSERLRGGIPGDLNAWRGMIKKLPNVIRRLHDKPTYIRHGPAHVFATPYLADPNAVAYLDPPYMHESRKATKVYGKHEMTPLQHDEMLEMALSAKCFVAISGYATSKYETALAGWHRTQWNIANHAGQNDKKERRTEVLWCNRIAN